MTHPPDYIRVNRQAWNAKAHEYAGYAESQWAGEPTWGIFSVPDTQVGMMPGDLEGKQVLEAGCGTGYVSAWMARRGARPVGLDNSPRQLETAARFQQRYQLRFPLVNGVAERLPFEDESFDIVISEYGASLWSDPYLWIPEAARVLRAGGGLVALFGALVAFRLPRRKLEGDPGQPPDVGAENALAETVRNTTMPGINLEMNDLARTSPT